MEDKALHLDVSERSAVETLLQLHGGLPEIQRITRGTDSALRTGALRASLDCPGELRLGCVSALSSSIASERPPSQVASARAPLPRLRVDGLLIGTPDLLTLVSRAGAKPSFENKPFPELRGRMCATYVRAQPRADL